MSLHTVKWLSAQLGKTFGEDSS